MYIYKNKKGCFIKLCFKNETEEQMLVVLFQQNNFRFVFSRVVVLSFELVPGLCVVRFVVSKVLHISVWAPVSGVVRTTGYY